ncbi:MAG: hypothetical protein Sylvanvirus11_12 [Sylvanvirus sp.]|uniref:Uncharacterized protein n=1 Tax=Sylvanvirus sp. TaxID=2487774 RepID=A0A3G5ALJ7_9VIRU|nr:MAG: hypothetical protein Sylvanvirus11_12 [Sylvanvirus sp.]
MSFNPCVHPGFSTKFNVTESPKLSQCLMFPMDTWTRPITRYMGECVANNPNLCGRTTALLLATVDTLLSMFMVLMDLLWSGLCTCITFCCFWWFPDRSNAIDFRDAFCSNLGRCTFSICYGPIAAIKLWIDAFQENSCYKWLMGCLVFPCVWPFTWCLSVFSLCRCPKGTGKDMIDHIDNPGIVIQV